MKEGHLIKSIFIEGHTAIIIGVHQEMEVAGEEIP